MKKRTWADIDGTIPDCTLGTLMDYAAEDNNGTYPNWDDPLPAWVDKLV